MVVPLLHLLALGLIFRFFTRVCFGLLCTNLFLYSLSTVMQRTLHLLVARLELRMLL